MGDQSNPKIVGHKMPSSSTILARQRKDLVSPFEISYLTLKNIYRRISKTTLLFTSFIFGLLSRKDEGMTEKSIEFADWHKHWNKTRTSGVVRNAGLTCSP